MTREEWGACNDGVVMLKLLGSVSGSPGSSQRRPLVLAACECARLVLPHVRENEGRPLAAIEMAERWARGESVTLDQIDAAAAAANAAADIADPAYTLYTAAVNAAGDVPSLLYTAAADAAAKVGGAAANTVAASNVSPAAEAIRFALNAASDADRAREGDNASRRSAEALLHECASIVRRHFPEPPL